MIHYYFLILIIWVMQLKKDNKEIKLKNKLSLNYIFLIFLIILFITELIKLLIIYKLT